MAFLQRAARLAAPTFSRRAFATKVPLTFEEKFERYWLKDYACAEHDNHAFFPHEAMARTFKTLLSDSEPQDLDAAKKLPSGWWLEKKHQETVPDGWHLDDRYWDWREAQIEERCKASKLSEEFRQTLLRDLLRFRRTTEDIPPPSDRWVDVKMDDEAKHLVKELHGYVPNKIVANRFTEMIIVSTPDNQEIVFRNDYNPENDEELTVMELDGVEVVYPPLFQTLDWVLSTPVPLHSFHELPLIKEVPYSKKVEP